LALVVVIKLYLECLSSNRPHASIWCFGQPYCSCCCFLPTVLNNNTYGKPFATEFRKW